VFSNSDLPMIPHELIPNIVSNFLNESDICLFGACSCVCKHWNSVVEPFLTNINKGIVKPRILQKHALGFADNFKPKKRLQTSLLAVGDPVGEEVHSGTSANTFGVLVARFLWGDYHPSPSRLMAPDTREVDSITFYFYEHKWNNRFEFPVDKNNNSKFTRQTCLIFYYMPNIRESFDFMVNSISNAQNERKRSSVQSRSVTVGQCNRRTTKYELPIPSFSETPVVIVELHEDDSTENNRVVPKYEAQFIALYINCPFKVVNVNNPQELTEAFTALAQEFRKIDSFSPLSEKELSTDD